MKISIILMLIIFSTTVLALPQPTGFVNDFANILPNKAAIEGILSEYEKNTSIEISVVTLEALPPDQTAATYANELFQEWGIGKKGEDNGVLILIVKNGTAGNRLRIELGYGIQGYITGAEAGRILDESLPFYEQGDYQKTVETILAGISEQLVNYVPGEIRSDEMEFASDIIGVVASIIPILLLVIIIGVAAAYSEKCPNCGSKKVEYEKDGEHCTCKKCGKRFKCKKKRSGFVPIFFAAGGGAGGFGGFGGGGSGGGGAGR